MGGPLKNHMHAQTRRLPWIHTAWVLLSTVLVAGCRTRGNDSVQEVRYLAWGTPEQTALEQKYCDEFNQKNPDVHVSLMLVPGSAYKQKMILMLASRTAPDIIRIDHYDFPSLVGKNYFYDMTPCARADPGFKPTDFFPMTIREGTYQGKLYGLNTMFGGQIVYYNRTMIKAAGLEDPYQLWKRGDWTYERMREYAIKMTKVDKNGRATQFGIQIPDFPNNLPFIWGFGGDALSGDGTRCLLGSPEASKAMQFLADLRWKDHCSPSPAQSADSAFNFEGGKIGIVFNWSGMSVRYRKVVKDFDWDICPMPKGPKSSATIVKGNQLVIYRESKHPEAAWRFIRFLTSPEVETELYAKLRRNCPSRKSVAYSKEFLDGSKLPHHARAYVTGIEDSREIPITSRWSEWTNALKAETDDLMSGRDRDATQVMKRASEAANKVLADEEWF